MWVDCSEKTVWMRVRIIGGEERVENSDYGL
jgi:hypothetical protein